MFEKYLADTGEIGYVSQVKRFFVQVTGLPSVKVNESVSFETGEFGVVFSLQDGFVEVILFSQKDIKVGSRCARSGSSLKIPVSTELLGKSIDPLGNVMGGHLPPSSTFKFPYSKGPELPMRLPVSDEFETGVMLVDSLIPIGKGQRELVLGDRKTGKTQLLYEIFLHQSKKGSICIWAAVGKRLSEVQDFMRMKEESGEAGKNSIFVYSYASDAPGLIYLAPYTAMTVAEYFCSLGHDVVLFIDDLSTHASVYREISLTAKRFPGRSAYPGDIFYIHSRLMERSGNFIVGKGKGSITTFPIAQSTMGDLTGYITTNLMSMTDGHIYFDTDLFDKGRRPAISPSLSVTRVGLQTQTAVEKEVTRRATQVLADYARAEEFSHFGAESSEATHKKSTLGQQLIDLYGLQSRTPVNKSITMWLVAQTSAGVWSALDKATFTKTIQNLISSVSQNASFLQSIQNTLTNGSIDDLIRLNIK